MSLNNIVSIRDLPPEEGKSYFFDANVWIDLLLPPVGVTSSIKEYSNFFEAVVSLGSNPMAKKKPVIIITNLLMSEIFNRYTRNKAKLYRSKSVGFNHLSDTKFYKDIYRQSNNFLKDLEVFKDNILAYEDVLKTVQTEDCCEPSEVLQNLSQQMDYNDYVYYRLCLKHRISLVTNDGDFKVPDVEIITANNKLLRK